MVGLRKVRWERFEIYFPADLGISIEPSLLIDSFLNASSLENKGRGGIKILNIEGKPVACRKYIHGGLLRGITGDVFFSGKRAIDEFETMLYLKEKGLPIVNPFCIVTERHFLTKNPHIFTYYEENGVDLMDFLNKASQRERSRAIKRLAELMWQLEKLGVYHPDLHLNNVLVESKSRTLLLLDFDKARKRPITEGDMERMFWRLNRYADKMEREGRIKIELREKLLFLRTYGRLSSVDMVGRMASKAARKSLLPRFGWFFERLLYGGRIG